MKRFIEMRGADAGSWQSLCALPAFWVGLLYDGATQKRVADMIADWTQDERDTLRRRAPVSGLATPFRGGTLRDLAADVVALAEQGLQARANLMAPAVMRRSFCTRSKTVSHAGKRPPTVCSRNLTVNGKAKSHRFLIRLPFKTE